MAEEVFFSTIQKLDSWLLNNAEHFSKEEVEGVKNELTLILDFLKDSTRSHNKLLNYLIADVVELAHDMAEDVADAVYYYPPNWVRNLKARMLKLGDEGGQVTEAPAPPGSPNVGDSEVVGLKEIIESLLRQDILSGSNWLYTTGPYLCVIEGVGGIGKTTLARELYNHPAVAVHFQRRGWVCVSGGKSNKQVLMELIVQVRGGVGFESLEQMENRSLQKMLLQHLKNKSYFIVLDNVEEETYLRSIFQALPKDGESRLLLTTQSRQMRTCRYISSYRSLYDRYHKMKFLEDEKSWELFLKTVYCGKSNDHAFPKKLENKGKKMLKKCGGLPLAIIEVGRQLVEKRETGIEWEELLESPIDFTQTLAALELSYRKLTPKVKAIFLCLCFFEEGTTIRIEKLLQIGILLKVIASKKEGDDALSVLKRYSFVELMHTTKILRPKNLEVKTIFHRLSVKRAKEEINFEILRNNGSRSYLLETFHRAIYCSREKFNYSMDQDEHLVSLFFRGGGYFNASPSYWERFEQLIILDMEGFGLKIVPDSFGKLTELRYLGLRNNHIQNLPVWLGCLKNLEVLDIALNCIMEVSDIIWEMDSLRHFYMSNIICLRPLKMDALKNIETLTYISIENWTYEVSIFPPMNKLRKLGIDEVDGKSNVSKLFASLARLMSICNLTLKGSRFKHMPLLDDISVLRRITALKLDGLLTRLPSAKNFPPNIRYLTLVNSSLDEDPMPILEKLSNLYYLKLRNAYTGQQFVISRNGFNRLNFLYIEELWHLRSIQVNKLKKWCLHQLEINNCPLLKTLPKVTSQREGFKIVTNEWNFMKHKGR